MTYYYTQPRIYGVEGVGSPGITTRVREVTEGLKGNRNSRSISGTSTIGRTITRYKTNLMEGQTKKMKGKGQRKWRVYLMNVISGTKFQLQTSFDLFYVERLS